jgi:hypothetical protein
MQNRSSIEIEQDPTSKTTCPLCRGTKTYQNRLGVAVPCKHCRGFGTTFTPQVKREWGMAKQRESEELHKTNAALIDQLYDAVTTLPKNSMARLSICDSLNLLALGKASAKTLFEARLLLVKALAGDDVYTLVPSGSQAIMGNVIALTPKEGKFGHFVQVTVADQRGFKVSGSFVEYVLNTIKVGCSIAFTADIEPKSTDMGWFKQPRNINVILGNN